MLPSQIADPLERYIAFVIERERIHAAKEAGAPEPLSGELIFMGWSFTNVRREDDRTTKWIAEHWRTPHADDPDLWFAMAVARNVNRIETLDRIGWPVPWDAAHFLSTIAAIKACGKKPYSGAYTIHVGPDGRETAVFQAKDVFGPLWHQREQVRPRPGDRLADFFDRLSAFRGMGGFMTAQVIADVKQCGVLKNASDWWSFAASGNGSRQGLCHILGLPIVPRNRPWPQGEADWLAKLHQLQADVATVLADAGIGRLCAQDTQNTLCEFRKFERTRLGEGVPNAGRPGPIAAAARAAVLALRAARPTSGLIFGRHPVEDLAAEVASAVETVVVENATDIADDDGMVDTVEDTAVETEVETPLQRLLRDRRENPGKYQRAIDRRATQTAMSSFGTAAVRTNTAAALDTEVAEGDTEVIDTDTAVSFFVNAAALTIDERAVSVDTLAERIRAATASAKALLPWLKLARFGERRTDRGSLRHDDNIVAISGIEADYDDERIAFDDAVETMRRADISAIVYTSPSHTPEKPRWRVLCPLSVEVSPERRDRLMNRLNGVFGGVFAAESWTLSQSYYFGSVSGNPAPKVEIIAGRPIDICAELDRAAIGKPNRPTRDAPAASERYPGDRLDPEALIEAARRGDNWHNNVLALVAHLVAKGAADWVILALAERVTLAGYAVEQTRREIQVMIDGARRRGFAPEPEDGPSTASEPMSSAVCDAGDLFGKSIPPRGWLLGNIFCRQFPSSLVGSGGTGKTAVRITQALSLATGRTLTGEHIHRRCKVLFLCFEDGLAELERRIKAAMMHHSAVEQEVRGWLFYKALGGADAKLLVSGEYGKRELGALEGWLRSQIGRLGVELIVLDPFVKVHSVEENDNSGIDEVVSILARLSVEMDVAVDLLHHTRKGTAAPGDADIGRGASAARDAGRLVYTLTPMREIDAALFGVGESERRSYVRMDPAKLNIAPPAETATWFKLVGVLLGNATVEYPNGDIVQTVERWYPPEALNEMSDDKVGAILDRIEEGTETGRRYSAGGAAKDRAAWPVVQEFVPTLTEKQAREVIAKWLKAGVLREGEYEDPVQRRRQKGLFVGARPGGRRDD